MKVYYDKDADLSLIKGKKVTILGYGSQGHAHALNLHDSGVKVTVGLRKGGASWDKAKKAGLKVAEIGESVKGADIVMMLMPDEHIAAVYKDEVEPNIKKAGNALRKSIEEPLCPRNDYPYRHEQGGDIIRRKSGTHVQGCPGVERGNPVSTQTGFRPQSPFCWGWCRPRGRNFGGNC